VSPQSLACAQWLQEMVASGAQVILPELSDYEVRRELLRAQAPGAGCARAFWGGGMTRSWRQKARLYACAPSGRILTRAVTRRRDYCVLLTKTDQVLVAVSSNWKTSRSPSLSMSSIWYWLL
jgi:hypothetical protein